MSVDIRELPKVDADAKGCSCGCGGGCGCGGTVASSERDTRGTEATS